MTATSDPVSLTTEPASRVAPTPAPTAPVAPVAPVARTAEPSAPVARTTEPSEQVERTAEPSAALVEPVARAGATTNGALVPPPATEAVVQRVPEVAAAAAAPASRPDDTVQIKVWDLPVRMLHWTLVLSVIVLSVTGFYIATPVFGSSSPSGFTMGMVRTVHITAGWVFATVLVARSYWAFAGNRWARWDQLLPFRRERREKIRPTIEYYIFLRLEAPAVVGHNPLAGATYVVLFLMFAFQSITGFALEALANPHGLMWDLTGWVFSLRPIPEIRLAHYLIMWMTIGFVVHHVYSAWLVDKEEHSGEISSIITGWKSLPQSRIDAEDANAVPTRRQRRLARTRAAGAASGRGKEEPRARRRRS